MSDPKTSSWLQRLVGADPNAALALEEQLNKAKEEARQLSAELEQERALLGQEREKLAEQSAKLAECEARARSAEDVFAAQLVIVEEAQQSKREAFEELERKHKQVVNELLSARTAHKRMSDEKEKLSQTLAAVKSQAAQGDSALRTARVQIEEHAKELAEAESKLQASEVHASTLELATADARKSEEGAKVGAANLRAELAVARVRRERALVMAQDLWRALQVVVGDGAALALVMGVDPGDVASTSDLTEAGAALKQSFETKALCQGLRVEQQADGIRIELRSAALSDSAVTVPWLVASATRFLERAAGQSLAVDSSIVEHDTLTVRLSPAAAEPFEAA